MKHFLYHIIGEVILVSLLIYKGKTELRITYEGKTPVDSVVIYKK